MFEGLKSRFHTWWTRTTQNSARSNLDPDSQEREPILSVKKGQRSLFFKILTGVFITALALSLAASMCSKHTAQTQPQAERQQTPINAPSSWSTKLNKIIHHTDDFWVGVSAKAMGAIVFSLLATPALSWTGAAAVGIKHTIFNRFAKPAIEAHKAEGRAEGFEQGEAQGFERGRAYERAQHQHGNGDNPPVQPPTEPPLC